MPVEMIVDHWNPSQKRYRFETFSYGPKNCVHCRCGRSMISSAISSGGMGIGCRSWITEEIPAKVAADTAYQNAIQHSDKQKARIEHEKALGRVMMGMLADDAELFKQFSDNPSFKKWLMDTVFAVTYQKPSRPGAGKPLQQ